MSDSEFRKWRVRLNQRLRIVCAISVFVGLLFLDSDPIVALFVSGLGVLGVIVTTIRLRSWQ